MAIISNQMWFPCLFSIGVGIVNTLHFVSTKAVGRLMALERVMSLELIHGSQTFYVCLCSGFCFITGSVFYNFVF